jgi:carbonic anhydrase
MITRAHRCFTLTVVAALITATACTGPTTTPVPSGVEASSAATAAAVESTSPSGIANATPSSATATEPSWMASAAPADRWSYAGPTGPDHWAELSPYYYACKYGMYQSPIEIAGADEGRHVDPILDYRAGGARIENDGRTIVAIPQVPNVLRVHSSSTVDSPEAQTDHFTVDWPLSHLQFRVPAEHAIYGRGPYPAEVQFVHQHANGAFTILGAMIEEGPEDNLAWAPYVDAMTTQVEGPVVVDIDWPNLIETDPFLEAWDYEGSLTTPPCTERVDWIFLFHPIVLSAVQIAKMRAAYDGNVRPLQPFNQRTIIIDLEDV